jgi:hypothetical protein
MSTEYVMAKRGEVEFCVVESSGRLELTASDNSDAMGMGQTGEMVCLDVTMDEAIAAAAKLLYAVALNSTDPTLAMNIALAKVRQAMKDGGA